MNALQITDHWYPDKMGGSCKYAYELARLLGQDGRFVTMTLQTPAHPEEAGLEVMKVLSKADLLKNHRLILKQLQVQKPDVVLLHSPLSYLYAARAAKQMGVPLVAVFHGPWGSEARHKYRNGRGFKSALMAKLTFIHEAIDKMYLRAVKRTVFLSQYMRGQAEALVTVSEKSDVIPFWTSRAVAAVAATEKAPPFHCLVIRRLEYRMGIQSLLDAVAEAPEGTHLTIVGTGTYEFALHEKVKALGIESRVTFAGRVSEEDKQRHLREADFMVLPSADLEGFGIVVLEALEEGLPVICREGVGFLDYHTPEMEGAIFRYRENDALVKLLSAPVRVSVEPAAFQIFTPEAVAERYRAVMDKAAA